MMDPKISEILCSTLGVNNNQLSVLAKHVAYNNSIVMGVLIASLVVGCLVFVYQTCIKRTPRFLDKIMIVAAITMLYFMSSEIYTLIRFPESRGIQILYEQYTCATKALNSFKKNNLEALEN